MAKTPAPSSTKLRRQNGARKVSDRRPAILDAALDVFSDKGYSQARLEDVATRAGIAKGTIYLYFDDKQTLFHALVTVAATPVLEQLEALAAQELPIAFVLDNLFRLFRTEVLGTRRKEVLRLVLSEGSRFPDIAAHYHQNVIARGLPLLGKILSRAAVRGELASDAAARFPHLVVAPLLLSLLWDRLFQRFEPLDVDGLFSAQRQLLLGPSAGDKP